MYRGTGLRKSILWIILFALCVVPACADKGRRDRPGKDDTPPGWNVTRLVVLGFRAAFVQGEGTGSVRDPLSGAVFVAEPVPEGEVNWLTFQLFESLSSGKRYELVSPGQAMGSYSRIVDSDRNVGLDTRTIIQKLGMSFDADAVLSGYVYRWRERDGTPVGVNSPASVAFDLQMTRPEDGAVLWRRKFDKTQKSLSENVLELSTFVKSKGRWVTAREFALMGLNKMLQQMPGGLENPSGEEGATDKESPEKE